MRIVTFIAERSGSDPHTLRAGALLGSEYIFDFQAAISRNANTAGRIAPRATNYLNWFDLDGELLPQAFDSYEQIAGSESSGGTSQDNILIPRCQARLVAPVPRPGKLICIGLNYRDHAAESNMKIPEKPVVFSKFTTSVIAPCEPVVLPEASQQVDYEAELAVVIGRRTKNVKAADALHHVLGYTMVNDVSARDFQFADGQWQRGKSCDTFCPMGPAVVTADEVGNPHKLAIKLRLNGNTMQDSNTDQLIFGVPQLIEFLSETITLEPGDVIATGTPAGVGFARKPPVFIHASDVMEVEIEKLGVLRSPVISATESAGRFASTTF
jgi:acylpyruvate hydrolase